MPRLTKEREKEIREFSKNGGMLSGNPFSVLGELMEEIEALRAELVGFYRMAERGVYVKANEYSAMIEEREALRAKIKEKENAIDVIRLETLAAMSCYIATPAEGYSFLQMLTNDIHQLGKERNFAKAQLLKYEAKIDKLQTHFEGS